MKTLSTLFCAAALAAAQPPKVALVNMQEAIAGTAEGREAEKQLDAEFSPRKAALDVAQRELATLEKQLETPNLGENDRTRLGGLLEEKSAALDRNTDKADADLKAAQEKVLRQLAPKMLAVIAQYARDRGYAVVFDISESEAVRLYAPNATDVTKDVIAAYDKQPARK